MATTPLPGQQPPVPPEMPKGLADERSPDAVVSNQAKPPEEIDDKDKAALMVIINGYTARYAVTRRPKIRQVLRGREYLKGKQYISFDPYSFTWFDPVEAALDGQAGQEDLSIYRYVNNLYGSLHATFVGSLTPEVPKARFMPANAKIELDVQTAKHASDVQAYIERKNGIKQLQKKELSLLWTDGCYFKYTRFVIDEDKAGVRKEPNLAEVFDPELIPAGYFCDQCGHDTPEQATAMLGKPACEQCGKSLSDADYHPAESGMRTVQNGVTEVPNGMVKQDVYGVLHVIGAPTSNAVAETPMLRLDVEVEAAAIRTSYPDIWDSVSASGGGEPSDDAARLARQLVFSAIGGRNNMTSDMMPTLSRTWLQPWAFAEFNTKEVAQKLTRLYPKGIMVVHLGEKFLECRAERMTDKWTWCPADEGFGLYPPGVGEPALDVQDQFNDLNNIVIEYFDRAACGGGFINEAAISSSQVSGKPVGLAGVFTGVKVKGDWNQRPLSDLFHEFAPTINDAIFKVIYDKITFAQMVTGVMPQIFGGGQQHVDTASGQNQALNTAMTRLGQFWDSIRAEHADAAQRGVKCAADNYPDYILDVIAGGTGSFTNKMIPIDELKGEFAAYAETDQGFPATYAEIRDRLERMFSNAQQAPWFQELFQNPNNVRMAARYLGFPGLDIPGEAEESKTMNVISLLLQGSASPMPVDTPAGPQTIMVASVHPDPDFEDYDTAKKVIEQWALENYQLAYTESDGYENVRAYYRELVEMEMMKAQEDAQRGMAVQGAGQPPPQPAGGPQ